METPVVGLPGQSSFFQSSVLPMVALIRQLVEFYVTTYVKDESEGKHQYYGQGPWINQEAEGLSEVYMTGCDAGVSFWSGVRVFPNPCFRASSRFSA
jgi:hypothetical protein